MLVPGNGGQRAVPGCLFIKTMSRMKTLKISVAIGLLAVLLSCGKKEEDKVAPVSKGVVTAQVDGQAFTSDQASAAYDKQSQDLNVVGFNSIHSMGFTLKKFTGPATFTLVDATKTGSVGSYTDMKTNTTYSNKEGRTGTVTVTKFDGGTIEGTFSLKSYNVQQKREVVITNGTFKTPVGNI